MGERSFSKSWGLRASGSFVPLPLPRHSFFCSCPSFLDEPREETLAMQANKRAVWLICYYSKDLYSPSLHQSGLLHLISLRSWKQQGVWTIQRFILFLFLVTKSYTLFMNVILCCWHVSWHLLTDMVVMFTNINHYFKWGLVNMLTWQSLANMLTYIYISIHSFTKRLTFQKYI